MSLASFRSLLTQLFKLLNNYFLSSVTGQKHQLFCKVKLSFTNCKHGGIFKICWSVLFSWNTRLTANVNMPSSCNSWWQVFCFLLVKEFCASGDHMKPRRQGNRSCGVLGFFCYSEPFRVDSPSIMWMYTLSFKSNVHIIANSIYPTQAFLRMKYISLLHPCPWDDSYM